MERQTIIHKAPFFVGEIAEGAFPRRMESTAEYIARMGLPAPTQRMPRLQAQPLGTAACASWLPKIWA
jgi:hypothetical protein